MLFEQLQMGSFANFQYVLGDEDAGEGAIVDPGFGADELVDRARKMSLEVTHVLLTHTHSDHIADLERVLEATDADVVAHPEAPVDIDVSMEHEGSVDVGGIPVRGYHTPGHAPDHVIYRADPYLFTGDLLFVRECGRADLDGSDPRAMHRSLFHVLAELPRELLVCPGHDYGPKPTSTLEEEFRENYTLEERSEDEFATFVLEP